MWPFNTKAQVIEANEAEEGLLKNENLDKGFGPKREPIIDTRRHDWHQPTWTWILQVAILTSSFTFFLYARHREPSDAECTRKMYPYSPALEVVEYEDTLLVGHFMEPSPYRGRPTPEKDALWERLWDWGAFNIPDDKFPLLNKSGQPWHHVGQEFGGGVAGLSWGYHQIHCLDFLRQMSFRDEYHEDGNGLPELLRMKPKNRREHLDHCIEVIRVEMMCSNDVTPYLVIEAEPDKPEDLLRVDFSIWKKCRNFEKIRDWMVEKRAIVSLNDYLTHPRGGQNIESI